MKSKKLLLFLSIVAALVMAYGARATATETDQPQVEQREKIDDRFFFINYDHRDVDPIYLKQDADNCIEDCNNSDQTRERIWFKKFEPIIQGSSSDLYIRPSKMEFFDVAIDTFERCKNASTATN